MSEGKLTRNIEDLLSAKLLQLHCFNVGEKEGLLAAGLRAYNMSSLSPYTYGMYAFGLGDRFTFTTTKYLSLIFFYRDSGEWILGEGGGDWASGSFPLSPWVCDDLWPVVAARGRSLSADEGEVPRWVDGQCRGGFLVKLGWSYFEFDVISNRCGRLFGELFINMGWVLLVHVHS